MPDINIEGSDGNFSAYLAVPAKLPAPAIVVAQEIFGVNQVMRDICDWLAGLGYLACCPDIFWSAEPETPAMASSNRWLKAGTSKMVPKAIMRLAPILDMFHEPHFTLPEPLASALSQ